MKRTQYMVVMRVGMDKPFLERAIVNLKCGIDIKTRLFSLELKLAKKYGISKACVTTVNTYPL